MPGYLTRPPEAGKTSILFRETPGILRQHIERDHAHNQSYN